MSLICSEDCEVKVQAMCLLRTMALSSVNTSKFKKILEAVLEPLTLLIDGDTVNNYKILNAVSKTLAVVCQVYPMLPSAKLEMVINSLLKLLEYKSSEIPSHACLGLIYLCDGRKEMVVAEKDFEPLINHLFWKISFYDSLYSRVGVIVALGTIVRWGSDHHIQRDLLEDSLRAVGLPAIENEANLFVSNLDSGVSNQDIRKLFSEIGELKRYAIHYDKNGWPNVNNDILSRFIELGKDLDNNMTEKRLRDVVLNFVIAGRDTTDTTLTWEIYMIMTHDHVAKKLHLDLKAFEEERAKEESVSLQSYETNDPASLSQRLKQYAGLMNYDLLGKLHYLHAMITETLRLYPAVPQNSKGIVEEDIFPDGTKVKA